MMTETNLWSPARVAEEATKRVGRKVSDIAVRSAIQRGDLKAHMVEGPEKSSRISSWVIEEEDAIAWEPNGAGRPRND